MVVYSPLSEPCVLVPFKVWGFFLLRKIRHIYQILLYARCFIKVDIISWRILDPVVYWTVRMLELTWFYHFTLWAFKCPLSLMLSSFLRHVKACGQRLSLGILALVHFSVWEAHTFISVAPNSCFSAHPLQALVPHLLPPPDCFMPCTV